MDNLSMDTTATRDDFLLILMGSEGIEALQSLIEDPAMRGVLVREAVSKFRRYLDNRDDRIWPLFRAAIVLQSVVALYPEEVRDPEILNAVDDLFNFLRHERLRFRGGFAGLRNGLVKKRGDAITRFTDYLNALRQKLYAAS